jgi:uncharacterized protein (TIGR03435 family)
MSVNTLSEICRAITPAVGNHLWQSTMFAAAAGLLALAFRRNHARIRYALWLTASAKFLIPFSLLSALGSHLAWRRGSSNGNAAMYVAMDQLGEPFSQPTLRPISETVPAIHSSGLFDSLPVFLAAAWFCGVLFVVLVWYVRWRRISRVIRRAVPVRDGRELELLRRFERAARMSGQIEIRVSPVSLEPGIFGVAWPILVWPQGISERLSDAHLESILAHELCHVRRRDNLSSAIHMAVEAIFWFHPIVWWMGTRLLEERERACDEHVLELGNDRKIYAESILKICEFCVGSRRDFVSGVNGADLKKRMVSIMTNNLSRNLELSKKLLLGVAGLLAVAIPIAFGTARAAALKAQSESPVARVSALSFQTFSIKVNTTDTPMAGFNIKGKPFSAVLSKPDRFMATNVTLHELMKVAFGMQDVQIVGGPDWTNSEKFDVDASIDSSLVEQLAKLSRQDDSIERGHMLQSLLEDRFKLTIHREIRELTTFALVVADGGPKFRAAKPGDTYADGPKGPGGRPLGTGFWEPEKGTLISQGQPIGALVLDLSGRLGQMVVDKTGLSGNYDFALQWTTDANQTADSNATSVVRAVQDQLGLRLERQNTPTEVIVIDHAERVI